MTRLLAIALSDAQTVMLILGSIGLVLLFVGYIVWNDVFRHSRRY